MDLFSHGVSSPEHLTPLAEKARPKVLDDYIFSESFQKKYNWFLQSIKKNVFPSIILWGPPGSGKTTLARILCNQTQKEFIQLSAISLGAKEIKSICEEAKNRKLLYQKGTVLFVDEIHRLNKSQQDVFLPYLEAGDVILVGATTENPSFELNSALLSRTRTIVLERHSLDSLSLIAKKILSTEQIKFSDEVLNLLYSSSNGDARKLISTLQDLIEFAKLQNLKVVDLNLISKDFQELKIYHDKSSDLHYNTISAFIKSIRGSDVDAGVYYLARLIEAGEDPIFIARRLVILASEDIGNAEPRALEIAMNAFKAVEVLGLPECAISLSQAVVFLASCPKSNSSYAALKKAQAEVKLSGNLDIPSHLKNPVNQFSKNMGHGEGYLYSHDSAKGWTDQSFLPQELANTKFYESKGIGFEKKMNEYLNWLKDDKK